MKGGLGDAQALLAAYRAQHAATAQDHPRGYAVCVKDEFGDTRCRLCKAHDRLKQQISDRMVALGHRRLAKLSPAEHSAMSRKGGKARWGRSDDRADPQPDDRKPTN